MISMHSPLGHGLRAAFGAISLLILGLAPKVVFAQADPEPAGGHRLATSKSAYLRMHAQDPIEWWPWGEEAFARAKAENKPIFLSIGFSSCHWCHVMHRESFKDPRVAEVLNRSFIAIKLDREERPDVDRLYMEAALLHGTNGAGWPASIFLDQDRRPFLLGNYFPPEAAHGRKGFRDLLLELEKAWKEDRTALVEVAARITADLARAQDHERGDELPDARIFGRARFVFDQMEDKRHGGFGEAPKFPHPMAHLFLLRESAREQMPVLADPVRLALIAMRNSALCDQIDGGFHRYCVDAAWSDPHFEQLLEDQALHAWLFLEAGVALKDPHFLREAEELLERARTVFAHEGGGFQHAIDSGVAGVEGAHATFSRKDLSAALPPDLLPLALEHFGLSETDTSLEEHHALRIVRTAEELAAAHELSESLVKERLKAVRAVLSAARKSRPKARIDAKIALGPNALMVHAFAHSALLTGNAEHLAIARRHFQFLEEHHARKKGPWARVTSGKVAEFDGDLLDHAAVLWAALRLHEASFDQKDLDRARAMAELIEAQFGKADGRFVDAISKDLVVQMAVLREAQSPSGAGLTVLGLAKLGAITGEPRWIERADRALRAVAGLLTSEPALSQTHLLALDDRLRNAPRITWTGPRDHPELLALRRAALSEYWPFVVHTQADTDDGAFVGAVVCVEETCFAPARTMAELREQIRAALDY